MKCLLLTGLLALAAAGGHPAPARAEEAPRTSVLGIGGRSCGYWIQLRTSGNPSGPDWLAGFLTAYNFWQAPNKNILAGTDVEGALAAMDGWCRAHPVEPIAQSAVELVRSLGPRP